MKAALVIQVVWVGFLLTVLCSSIIGCMGQQEKNNVVFVYPGGVVTIATDKQIHILAVGKDGKEYFADKSLAGFVAMPRAVYDKMVEDLKVKQ